MARTVSSPDGNRWYVRRVWLPWQPKWRGRRKRRDLDPTDADGLELASGCAPDALDDVLVVVAIVVFVLLLVFFVWPVLVALLELVLLSLLVLLGGLARVLLRRPWIVEATPATGQGRFRWKVVGWRRSGAVVDAVADQLTAGTRSSGAPTGPE
jgi:hypothetical protein